MSDALPPRRDPEPPLGVSCDPEYREALHRWLLRRLRNPDKAEDVLQEVYLRLYRHGQRLIRDPRSYLFGIAFHVISDLQMDEKKDSVVSYDTEIADREQGRLDLAHPDNLAERLSLRRQLESALLELPVPYRTVLLLVKRDGMSYEEAAKASGLSVHTVEKYLIRARAQLMAKAWDR
jgi:RNA polymerase sigma-70 factor, ECF subfamily